MVIVSMAVIASRVKNIPAILKSLERQSRRPDLVLLHYSHEPWHHDTGIRHLDIPATSLDVETVVVPNIGSCRKYLFAAERYRHTNASILLLDDDLVWERNVVTNLATYQNSLRRVVGTRGWSQFEIVTDPESGEKVFQRPNAETVIGKNLYKPKEVFVTSSGWATMFYAKDVSQRMFDRDLQNAVKLGHSDEVFLAAMIPHAKSVIPMPKGFYKRLNSPSALFKAPETARAKALQAELLGEVTLDIAAEALRTRQMQLLAAA